MTTEDWDKNRPYTVETPGGEFLFQAPQHILVRILNLHDMAVERLKKECVEQSGVCIIHASRNNPLVPGYPEVHVYSVPPWQRLLTDDQRIELIEINTDCVRDDPSSMAESWADEMSTLEVKEWLKEFEADEAS
jgi:hypothetical protein